MRWVLHIDMDAFYASVEQLTRPTLRGRPVLVGGVSGRGVVAGASYEARVYGARSAMPMYQAMRLVGPRAVTVTPRKEVYAAASRRVFELIESRVEVVERLSIDEGFMEPAELSGLRDSEPVRTWANELRALIREHTGLPSSIGAGPGKQYAKIGSSLAKPDGVYAFEPDTLLEHLHPLPVSELWGVGPVTQSKLAGMGVSTIGQLAEMDQREVEISLGNAVGTQLWNLARGQDPRPVEPRAVAKSVSAEHTYPTDLLTPTEVDAALDRAAADAHRRLLADGRGARTITVKLRMADFRIESRSLTLPYATDDLPVLRSTAFKLVRYPREVGPIRLVGVGFSGLEVGQQHVLFPELEHAPETSSISSAVEISPSPLGWRATQDVHHLKYGHGWIQGAGHGVVSVRFETRATGPGFARTFSEDDPDLRPADPLDSLAWD